MTKQAPARHRKWRTAYLMGGLIAASWCAGAAFHAPAAGQTRRTPTRESFKSGATLSQPILRQIAETLERMDARLANIEQAAMEAARAARAANQGR